MVSVEASSNTKEGARIHARRKAQTKPIRKFDQDFSQKRNSSTLE